MLQFDPKTYHDWKNRDIKNISIELIASGCEGTSIKIHENIILDWYISVDHIDTTHTSLYVSRENEKVLWDAYITHTGAKWILKSESILTRCGCGKSFWLKTGDSKIDKIRLLKSKLASKKWTHHG